MKHAAAMFAGVLITGTSGVWGQMSKSWKAITIMVGLVGFGFTAGSAFSTNLKIPARVGALEVEHTTMLADNEEDRCLLRRVLCRLDGRTANSCDLQYAVRRGACTD